MENVTESSAQEYQCEYCTYRRAFFPYHSGTALEILHTKGGKTPTNSSINKKTNHTYLSLGNITHTNSLFFFQHVQNNWSWESVFVKKSSIIRTWQWKLLRIRYMSRDHHAAVRCSSVTSDAKVKPWRETFFMISREKTILRVILKWNNVVWILLILFMVLLFF